ncbi:MAG: DUF4345 family protein [Planctomycetaceae bacterium]
MARLFIVVVGLLYVVLGVWCAVAPTKTSKYVGFQLAPGGGQSEFFTVYGGLELGLGLAFLIPLFRTETTGTMLLVSLLLHASLVLFRSLSFMLYTDIPSSTYGLAVVEWILLLGSLGFWWTLPKE